MVRGASFTDRKSLSPTANALQYADVRGYHSASGEFNYYPTSAHKRQRLSSDGAEVERQESSVERNENINATLSSSAVNRVAASPSSAGLSRSPSQPTPAKDVVIVRRSVSLPLSNAQSKLPADIEVASTAEQARGRAPLLHRYRTSQASPQSRASPRSASSPAPSSQLLSCATNKGNPKSSTRNIRRSLLTMRHSTRNTSGPSLRSSVNTPGTPSPRETGFEDEAGGAEKDIDLPAVVSGRPSFRSAQPTAAEVVVPVRRVCLGKRVEADAVTDDAVGGRCEHCRVKANTTHESECQPESATAAEVQGGGVEDGTTRRRGAVSVATRTANALLSMDVSRSTFCSDERCMHSERSIGEFILMQRELRRCYAAIENYAVVVAQLRQECAEAWGAHHQLQRQCAQRGEEVEAAVRAELTEQISQSRQQHANGTSSSGIAEENGPTSESDDNADRGAVNACLEATWRETLDELRRALQEERAAHAATREQLNEALLLLARGRREPCASQASQQPELEEHRWDLVEAAVPHPGGAVDSSTSVSLSHSPSQVACMNDGECLRLSDGLSPVPRLHTFPHPHLRQAPPPSRVAATQADDGMADLSMVSAVTIETSVKEVEAEAATSRTGEEGTNATVDSAQDTSSERSPSLSLTAGGAPEAVGSGIVVVEPCQQKKHDTGRKRVSPAAQATSVLLLKPSPSTSTGLSSGSTPDSLARLLEKITTALGKQDQQKQQQQHLAFPPPPHWAPADACATCEVEYRPWVAQDADEAATSTTTQAERKCEELLCALMDKERQFAEVAEERTKYKRLLEEQAEVVPNGAREH